MAVVSTNKSEGMLGGHSLGGACGNIKVLSSTLFPHQSCISIEGLQSQHALRMLGRTLYGIHDTSVFTYVMREEGEGIA